MLSTVVREGGIWNAFPEPRPVPSKGFANWAATALASTESSPFHAAREQKMRFCLIEQHVWCESLQHQRQATLLKQLALGSVHHLHGQTDEVPSCAEKVYLHGLLIGM